MDLCNKCESRPKQCCFKCKLLMDYCKKCCLEYHTCNELLIETKTELDAKSNAPSLNQNSNDSVFLENELNKQKRKVETLSDNHRTLIEICHEMQHERDGLLKKNKQLQSEMDMLQQEAMRIQLEMYQDYKQQNLKPEEITELIKNTKSIQDNSPPMDLKKDIQVQSSKGTLKSIKKSTLKKSKIPVIPLRRNNLKPDPDPIH